jgi:hypothetical protein
MKEILLSNGFKDEGLCPVCSGQAWKYTKLIGRTFAEVKVYGRYENTMQGRSFKERGDAMISINRTSKTKVTAVEYLQSTLDYLKLNETATA